MNAAFRRVREAKSDWRWDMVGTKTRKPRNRRKSGSDDVQRPRRVRGAKLTRGSANEAEAATRGAWSAVKDAVNSGKTQPATAARATGNAMRNVERSGAEQTSVAADAIARAAEEVLKSAMSEARFAAKA